MLTLAEIKNQLDMTWDDEADNKKVLDIARRAQTTVAGLIGTPARKFFTEDSESSSEGVHDEAEQLFLDACRYMRDNAFEDFRTNFASNILSIRAANSVNSEEETTDE